MNNNEILENLIFLDTETTGLDQDDKLFQVAYIFNDKQVNELFNPEKKICIEASETTGYTNKDTDNKEVFIKSKEYNILKNILQNEENIFIAHNAKFDIEMLKRDGLEVRNFIDTLKVARALDENNYFGAYRLQYLRYAMELEVKGAQAHDAMGDVLVLKELFLRLYFKMQKDFSSKQDVLNEMIRISSEPSLIKKINFGKHKDKFLEDVLEEDRGYLEWLLKEKEKQKAEGDNDEDWIYTLNYYLDK